MISLPSLNTKRVSQMLGLHPTTVQKLAKTGQIKCYRYGRGYKFYLEDIETFIKSRGSK